MANISNEYKGLANTPPNFPGAIRGRKNLVPGKLYEFRCIFPDDGHHKPCLPYQFTFEGDIDSKYFKASGIPYKGYPGYSYADIGIEPYRKDGKEIGWHKTHYVIPLEPEQSTQQPTGSCKALEFGWPN